MINYSNAIEDFRHARQRAILKDIIERFTGASNRLLSFDEVRQSLKAQSSSERGLMDIPLESIIGSVNRYSDFTRDFLPKDNVKADRWARVELAAEEPAGLPPIEVYKIGEVYFVKDGNHRVSVARQMGTKSIAAYVTEVQSSVPLTADTRPEDLIIKGEYAEFLEKTRLNETRPGADLSLTVPGQYPVLEEHIAVHRYYMGIEQSREIPYEEAAAHWFDTVYQPTALMILEKGILRYFPERTEADLYLWLAEHRAILERELGVEIKPEDAAVDLAEQFSPRPDKVITRFSSKIVNTILPESLEGGPPAGQWRKEKLAYQDSGIPSMERMFSDILVPVSGRDSGWNALEQAIQVAQRENGRLHGLHVVPPILKVDSPEAKAVQEEFEQRCQQANIPGSLQLVLGDITQNIIERSRWNDLVIVNLDYPPSPQPMTSLNHGFRNLLQRSPRPVMAVPGNTSGLKKALLAFDGSPKAFEALYLAAYISAKWKLPLAVIIALESGGVTEDTLEKARQYLDTYELEPALIKSEGPIDQAIMKAIDDYACDFLLMGGYGHSPLLDVVLGSTVNQLLNDVKIPVLICR